MDISQNNDKKPAPPQKKKKEYVLYNSTYKAILVSSAVVWERKKGVWEGRE